MNPTLHRRRRAHNGERPRQHGARDAEWSLGGYSRRLKFQVGAGHEEGIDRKPLKKLRDAARKGCIGTDAAIVWVSFSIFVGFSSL